MKKTTHKTSWDPVASWYDELLSGEETYQAKVILPNVLRLLPGKGKHIIDIACGQGFFSREYANTGATVLGIDISPELIQRAREQKIPNAQFEVASASRMEKAETNGFDGAIIILALQNIEDMQGTFAEAARVLKQHGTLVIVLNHPCFRIPKASAWGYDEGMKVQYRRIERYGIPFSVKIDMRPGKKQAEDKAHTTSFHRPLQEYMKALAKAGFTLAGLEEWISHKKSEPGARASAEDTARKEFPLFLALVARKT